MPSLKFSVLLAVTCAAALHAQQAGQKPDFNAHVDYVEIPVRVLDNKGRFVRNLAQTDFEVLEDGTPQRLVDFSFIGSSPQNQPLNAVTRGKLARESSRSRVYAIVLDDLHISGEDTVKARSLALEFVRRYAAADDDIAIVFTSGSRGQDPTRDRTVLAATLDRLRGQWDRGVPAALKEAQALGVLSTIEQVSRTFADTVRGTRRAIVLMTPGFFDGMHALANETGGFSVTGTDGFADAFRRIVSDFSEYYVLGYYSGRRDAGAPLRRNEVRVSRAGTKAFYRSTYVAPQ